MINQVPARPEWAEAKLAGVCSLRPEPFSHRGGSLEIPNRWPLCVCVCVKSSPCFRQVLQGRLPLQVNYFLTFVDQLNKKVVGNRN